MPYTHAYYVVLDANILIRDFWMTGPSFSYLMTHQFLQHRPAVPEIALLEARNELKRRAETLLANRLPDREGSKGNTQRLLRLFNYRRNPRRGNWNVEKLLERWDKRIARVLRHFRGVVIPSPDVPLSVIAKRSLERRKPFSQGDRGFRDTLIWLSTLDLASPDSSVSFVTENTADFFDAVAREPHPDLAAEIEEKLAGEWKLIFHRSLDEFITHFDADRAASAQALQRSLIGNTLSEFDLWEWLEENIVEILGDYEFDEVRWAGVPHDAEAPILVELEQLVGLDISRVKHITEDVYRAYCDVAFVGRFSCAIGFNAAETVVHPNQIVAKQETDEIWTDIVMQVAATVLIAIDYDVKASLVVDSFWMTLHHWKSFQDEIDELEATRAEVQSWQHPAMDARADPAGGA